MKVRLTNTEYPDTIQIRKMKDGDIAVIVDWGRGNPEYVNLVVQRFDEHLAILGLPSGSGWSGAWAIGSSRLTSHDCRVRLLKSGETLVLE